jgi:20S proteasome alpha/beta subunit
MTLGIAAIANWEPAKRSRGNGHEVVVLAADKEYEFSDGTRISSPVPKRFGLFQSTAPRRCGWFALFAADDTDQADWFIERFRRNPYVARVEAGKEKKVPTTQKVISLIERAYAGEHRKNRKFGPEFAVAGFDEHDRPVILYINENGRASNQKVPGYTVVGSGGSHAWTRLVWHNTQPNDPLFRVLYKTFDAKRHAERAVGKRPTSGR